MDAETLSQQLDAKIQEIKRTLDEAKASGLHLNEATTESIIIDPLLQILGYNPLQRIKRDHDSVAKNFPDYTLLPNTPHKWFLEVKKLDLPLKDGEAAQAVNYANNQGAEWAVLTNGRTWYIYNAHLRKPLAEKRVTQINDLFLDEDAIERLLHLSRVSMQSGGLTQVWMHRCIVDFVKRQLETQNSPIREQLRSLSSEELNVTISDEQIGKAIAFVSSGIQYTPPKPALDPPPQDEEDGLIFYTFPQLAKDKALATGSEPNTLMFADGHHEEASSWAEVLQKVVEWVGSRYDLPPLPFKPSPRGERDFINSTAKHGDGKVMEQYRDAKVGTRTVCVHTKTSTWVKAANVTELLRTVGAPSDAVKVKLQ